MGAAPVILAVLCCLMIPGSSEANICSYEPNGTSWAHPQSRSQFIWCWNGQENIRHCASGEEFNPFDRVCEVSRWLPPSLTTRAPQRDPCHGRPNGSFVPDPTSRERFFWCNNGRGTLGSCDPGYVFHPEDSVCDADVPHDRCRSERDNTLFPDPSSRFNFIVCLRGATFVMECPAGMVFHARDLVCEPENSPPPPVRTTQGPTRTTVSRPPVTRTTTARPLPTRTTMTTRTTTRTTRPTPTRAG